MSLIGRASRSIADGTVEVSSLGRGRGATFSITLPVAVAPQDRRREPSDGDGASSDRLDGIRVLDRALALAAGFQAYVPKPIARARLVRSIKALGTPDPATSPAP
jgi:hypothetical protein